MDWKVMLSALGLLFVAELGDKTQLTVICMTAQTRKPLPVFVGAAIALMGAAFGEALASIIPIHILRKVAAGLFVVMGVLMFFDVL